MITRGRVLAAGLLCFVVGGEAQAQQGGDSPAETRLEFPSDAPRLANDATVAKDPEPDPRGSDRLLTEPEESPVPARRPALLLAAAILMLVVGFLLVKFRPRKGRTMAETPATGTTRPDDAHSRPVTRGNRPGSAPSPLGIVPTRVVGTLTPWDGSSPIPLTLDLLISIEGLVIGRAMELCHVEIRDPQVSRRHLRLRLVREAIWVEDLNSTGGTEVDAKRMVPFKAVRLHSGQSVRIAGFPYRFESKASRNVVGRDGSEEGSRDHHS